MLDHKNCIDQTDDMGLSPYKTKNIETLAESAIFGIGILLNFASKLKLMNHDS